MKLSLAQERIMAVMAHPDDAELLCAGTLARAKADGSTIAVCVMCQGDKGIAATGHNGDLERIRKDESHDAAKTVGAELFWFAAPDGELFDCYDQRRKLIEIYRQFQPTLVITHCPEDYHPDHRASYALADAASWFCASRGHVTSSDAMSSPPALWLADSIDMAGFLPDFYVDISQHLQIKQSMLQCHRSQLQRGKDSDFSPLTELMTRQCQARGSQAGVAAAEAFRWHHSFKRTRAF